MTLTTIDIPEEIRVMKKNEGMTWLGLIRRGVHARDMSFKITELQEELAKAKERNTKLALLLEKYVDLANKTKDT